MNFEYLVQRYIDGEITPNEDLQLQKLMKDSPYLRSQFDQIVHIQYAYTQASKPVLNEKDSAAIFDSLKIAMVASIASTAHAPMTTSSMFVGVTNFILPVLLSLFFLLSPNNATTPLLKYVAYQHPNSLNLQYTNSKEVITAKPIKSLSTKSLVQDSTIGSFSSDQNISLNNDDVIGTTNNEPLSTIDITNSNNLISGLTSVPENTNTQIESSVNTTELLIPKQFDGDSFVDAFAIQSLNKSLPFVSNNTPIKLEFVVSASSNNFNSLGSIRTSPILSQYVAINYGISVKNRFGIEFGSTSFVGLAYGAVTKPQVSEIDYGSGVQSATNSSDQDPIETPIDNSKIKPTQQSKYNCEDIEYRKNIQIYQSSVFYEREIFETSFLSVNSRVGVGVTNIGVTSYTKTLLEVKPNDSFSFFGGAEYRVLTGNAGSALQNSTTSASMLSIQTGITIKF